MNARPQGSPRTHTHTHTRPGQRRGQDPMP